MKSNAGFSLIELLIVVAIILVIAAIAIPNLLSARISANEASAEGAVRTIATAEATYNGAYPTLGYAALANLGGPAGNCTPGPATACILDSVLTTGSKSGYTFTASGLVPINGANTEFLVTAVPQLPKLTGVKAFCAAEDNVTRYINPSGGPATHAICLGNTYSPVAQ
ncbi:MAG: prepilin-type N-terminal cleavage/methylation domain-containing protein [Acidobacteria bacterium]|nr:prepilin-type N-terminal cleavage/methylation domain-containing protein [Acidobacteriota bacterium]